MLGRKSVRRRISEYLGKIKFSKRAQRDWYDTKPGHRRLDVEPLEDRRLLSVSKIGDLIQVSDTAGSTVGTSADSSQPSVAYDHEHDRYLVVWRADMRVDNQYDLFGQLINGDGTKFGGDGRVDFRLPDLRGLEPVCTMHWVIALVGVFPSRN